MTTFNWTTLSNGQSIVFNPNADVLRFNDTSISAAEIGFTSTSSAPLTTTFIVGGKSVTLQTSFRTLTTTNLTFADGSAFLIGDNSTGTGSDDNANIITGGTGNDRLVGLGGNDQLTGGAGNDRFSFSARAFGSDQIMDFAAGDKISLSFLGVADLVSLHPFMSQSGLDVVIDLGYGGVNETITIKNTTLAALTLASFTFNTSPSSISRIGTTGSDVLFGGSGNDTLQGSGGHDVLVGGSGNDLLSGGTGSDQLFGGAGNDRFSFDVRVFGSDQIMDFAAGDKIDLSFLGVADLVSLQPFMSQSGLDVVISMEYANFAETITIKNTTLASLTASSFIFNTSPSSINQTGTDSKSDVLFGGSGNDTLQGSGGHDVLVGGSGNDLLSGGTGSDQLFGGAGNDRFSFDVRVFGSDQIMDFAAGDKIDLSFLGVADLVSLQPFMSQSGLDVVITMEYANFAETITIKNTTLASLTASSFIFNTSPSSINQTGTDSKSDVLFGGSGNDTLQGSGGHDVLVGGSGNDLLSGGTGSDQLFGGAGNDRFSFDVRVFGSDQIMDFAAGDKIDLSFLGVADLVSLQPFMSQSGLDVVISMEYANFAETITIKNTTLAALTPASFIFNTSLSSINQTGTTGSDVLFGGSGNDTLQGSGGGDVLVGGSGNDLLSGGTGNDTYITDVSTDQIIEALNEGTDTVQAGSSYTLSANLETLILTGTANTTGTGNALDNTLIGNSGNNILNGGTGKDTMTGGSGNDTYFADVSTDQANEALNEGTDTVEASSSYTLFANVEHLILTGTANTNGTGNDLNNNITGNSGNNVLNGGAGTDAASYANAAAAVSVNLSLAGAQNTGSMGSDTLTSIENLLGSAFRDTLTGNSGNNVLDGGVGVDTMAGGQGDDTYIVNSSTDVITEADAEGTDTAQSSASSYTLGVNVEKLILTGVGNINGSGNAGNNTLTGNSGNNVLNGGAGNDTLVGGIGADVFIYNSVDTSVRGGADSDTLQIAGSTTTLNLTTRNNSWTADLEIIDLTGTGNNSLVLALGDVLAFSSTTDTLRIDGNAGDQVTATDGGWIAGADQVIGANTYHSYTQAAAQLLIDADITSII